MDFLVEALVLGVLYGIGPCTLFCAPVIVPLVMSYSKDGREGVKNTLIFSLGRIVSYASLGAASGLLGAALSSILTKEVLAASIIGFGVLLLLRKHPKTCLLAGKVKGKHASFTSGIILGLSPCYPLIGLLTLAATSGSPITGLAMGVIFGLGTTLTPLIILGFFAGRWAKFSKEFADVNLIVTGLFLIAVGIATLLF
jgi:sulfite exporter TauE/SafE